MNLIDSSTILLIDGIIKFEYIELSIIITGGATKKKTKTTNLIVGTEIK